MESIKLAEKEVRCPVCNSTNLDSTYKVTGVWNANRVVSYCLECELYFLPDTPDKKEIFDFYESQAYHYSKIQNFIKPFFRKFRVASQCSYIKKEIGALKNKRVLEVGAGDGLLLSKFRENILKGTEYSGVYKDQALKKYGIGLISDEIIDIKEKYDLVILSHVFEHLPNINKVVGELAGLLENGGYLFIEVPNSPKPRDRDYFYINKYLSTTHLYNFTSKSLRKVFKREELEIFNLSRCRYNLSFMKADEDRELISEIMMGGNNFKLKFLLPVIFYLIKSFVLPENSYENVNEDLDYTGLGDNLRVLIRKTS